MESRLSASTLRAVTPGDQAPPALRGAEDLRAGHRLARRYELVQLVADGGTSRIFRARDLESTASGSGDPLVALKIPHESTAELARELVRHEALIARQLNHPGIARIHDFAHHGPVWFLIMEWVVGTSLTALLRSRRRRLPLRQVRRLLANVADALGHAHARGIVHGDVKPDNIHIDQHGGVRLLDWTTARYVAGRERAPLAAMTTPAFEGFTPAYASPQAQQGAPAAPSDDVFSLACVAYSLLTGGVPNQGTAPYTFRNRWSPSASAAMRVVNRGMHPDPARRHRTPQAFSAALDRACARPARITVVTGAACAAAAMAVPAYLALQQVQVDRHALDRHRTAQQDSAALLGRMTAAPPERLPAMLASAEAFGEPWRSYLLRRMRQPVLEHVGDHVSNELSSVHSAATLSALDSLLSSAGNHYPDSARLAELAARVNAAQQRRRAGLVADYRTQWRQTDFSESGASRIREQASELRDAGQNPAALVPGDAVERFADRLHGALARGDLDTVAKLDAFRRATAIHASQLDAETRKRLHAARRLAAYLGSDEPRGPFPERAANAFYGPHFSGLRERMEATWSTPPLLSVKRRLDELAGQLPATYEPLRALRSRLAGRLRVKARYYAGVGNGQRARYYARLAGELSG